MLVVCSPSDGPRPLIDTRPVELWTRPLCEISAAASKWQSAIVLKCSRASSQLVAGAHLNKWPREGHEIILDQLQVQAAHLKAMTNANKGAEIRLP